MADLAALIARVEAATGPDRELDTLLLCAFPPMPVQMIPDVKWPGRANFQNQSGEWDSRRALHYTASIDVALALVERILPDWTVASIGQNDAKRWTVELREGYQTSYGKVIIEPSGNGYRGTTAPLAIILAALKALQARAGRTSAQL